MLLPAMTHQLACRIEQSNFAYSFARLDGMRLARGNPLNIEISRYGNAIAFLIKTWQNFWYGNKVLGIEPAGVDDLDEMVTFFDGMPRARMSCRDDPSSGGASGGAGLRVAYAKATWWQAE